LQGTQVAKIIVPATIIVPWAPWGSGGRAAGGRQRTADSGQTGGDAVHPNSSRNNTIGQWSDCYISLCFIRHRAFGTSGVTAKSFNTYLSTELF